MQRNRVAECTDGFYSLSRKLLKFTTSSSIEENCPKTTLEVVTSSNIRNTILSRDEVYHRLQYCALKKDLNLTRSVHYVTISNGLEFLPVFSDHLIRLYDICNDLQASNQVFLKVSTPSSYTWNALITAHFNHGENDRALYLYYKMLQDGCVDPDKVTFLCVLKVCANNEDVKVGYQIHSEIVNTGLDIDIAIGSSLIDLYSKCGRLQEAKKVFDVLPHQDIVSWGAIISGHAGHGYYTQAVELFEKAVKDGIKPDRGMYISAIKSYSCLADVHRARNIHKQILNSKFKKDIVLASTVIDMYSACGNLKDACETFESMSSRDVVAWGAMMSAYINFSHFLAVLRCYEDMLDSLIDPDKVILLCVLKACRSLQHSALGKLVHLQVIHYNLDSNLAVANTLIDTYAKCGSLVDANCVFEKLPIRDVVSWDIIISGYAANDYPAIALDKFYEMKCYGIVPNAVTFICVLKVCVSLQNICTARLVHDQIVRSSMESDATISNAIVDMYAGFHSLFEAYTIFIRLSSKNIVTWGILIAGFAQSHALCALYLYSDMQKTNVTADDIAYLSVMKACVSLSALNEGHLIHDHIIRHGLETNTAVGNSVIDMYAKCGSLNEAHRVFDVLISKDVMSWGSLIGGYSLNEEGQSALVLFERMQRECIEPDQAVLVSVLKACGAAGAVKEGQFLHDMILKTKFQSDKVIGNALLDMYIKCGSILQAHKVFNIMPMRDIVTWSTMIAGCTYHDLGSKALQFYQRMQETGIQPNEVVYLCALKACISLGAVEFGKLVYEQARRGGMNFNISINNTLIQLYAKYGNLDEAVEIFDELPDQDSVSWSAIMEGHASHGDCKQVIHCFQTMIDRGFKPDDMIFNIIFVACINAGLIEEAFIYFKSMIENHGISPHLEHYTCLVHALGHSGMLKEAMSLVHTMPNTPDSVVWTSFLNDCWLYGDEEVGCSSFYEVQEK